MAGNLFSKHNLRLSVFLSMLICVLFPFMVRAEGIEFNVDSGYDIFGRSKIQAFLYQAGEKANFYVEETYYKTLDIEKIKEFSDSLKNLSRRGMCIIKFCCLGLSMDLSSASDMIAPALGSCCKNMLGLEVSLILGPLAVIDSKYASLIEPRRAVGLAAFFFAVFHITLVSGIYFSWQPLAALAFLPNIVAVPAAFVLLLAAITASDFAVQKMGMKTWKTVQRLVYIGFAFVLAHVLLVTNGAGSLGPLQICLLALAVAAIALQFYGFYLMRKRKGAVSTQPA